MIKLKNGDVIKLFPSPQLKEVFEERVFFTSDFREEASNKLGGKRGIVERIESKYQFDYFFFLPEGENVSWSIPYQAVDFTEPFE